MKPHEKRVVDEKLALDENIKKLSDFMHGNVFAEMLATDQGLLMVQVRQMKSYSETLGDRIARF